MTDFEPFFDAYGKPTDTERPSAKLLKDYENRVPAQLIEFWERFGFGGFAKGLVWVVNPTQLEDVLAEWAPAKKTSRAVPAVRTAFGNIVYWQGTKFTFLDVHYDKAFDAGTDTEVLFGFYLIDDKSRTSVLQEPKFKKALKAHGSLARDEMYGYTLPLVMGGTDEIKNMAKVKMREQLSILAQAHGK